MLLPLKTYLLEQMIFINYSCWRVQIMIENDFVYALFVSSYTSITFKFIWIPIYILYYKND